MGDGVVYKKELSVKDQLKEQLDLLHKSIKDSLEREGFFAAQDIFDMYLKVAKEYQIHT